MGRQRPSPSHVHVLSEFKTFVDLEVDSIPAVDHHQRLLRPLQFCPAVSKLVLCSGGAKGTRFGIKVGIYRSPDEYFTDASNWAQPSDSLSGFPLELLST
eukprot:3928188-Amphidinium_carterae.1